MAGYTHKFSEFTHFWKLIAVLIVLDQCQDQRTCRLVASAEEFGDDPCPGTSKYLEVAYKCRPSEFRSRVTCEGGDMLLRCSKSQRLVIYSAMYGRGQTGNLECPASQQFDTNCESECSLEVVMRLCHGRRKCSIPATVEMFSNPCAPGTPKYLSVVYTCVPKRILKELKEDEQAFTSAYCGGTNDDESSNQGVPPWLNNNNRDNTTGLGAYVPPPSTFDYGSQGPATRAPVRPGKSVEQPSNNQETVDCKDGSTTCVTNDPAESKTQDEYIGFLADWVHTWKVISEHKEKFILYMLVGLFAGIILLLLVIIVRLLIVRKRTERQAKLDISEPIPNSQTPAPSGRTQENDYLLDTPDRPDGIEMLSFNTSGTYRPKTTRPSQTTTSTFTSGSSTLPRSSQPERMSTHHYNPAHIQRLPPQSTFPQNTMNRHPSVTFSDEESPRHQTTNGLSEIETLLKEAESIGGGSSAYDRHDNDPVPRVYNSSTLDRQNISPRSPHPRSNTFSYNDFPRQPNRGTATIHNGSYSRLPQTGTSTFNGEPNTQTANRNNRVPPFPVAQSEPGTLTRTGNKNVNFYGL